MRTGGGGADVWRRARRIPQGDGRERDPTTTDDVRKLLLVTPKTLINDL